MERIGESIKELRIKNGISMRELSRRSSVSLAALSRMENGDTNPTIKTLCLIAGAFELRASEFMTHVESRLAA